jgi:hypothetical protein
MIARRRKRGEMIRCRRPLASGVHNPFRPVPWIATLVIRRGHLVTGLPKDQEGLIVPKVNHRGAATAALGGILLVAGMTLSTSASAAGQDAQEQGSLVETFEYPNGNSVPGIELKKGDGRILHVPCPADKRGVVIIESYVGSTDFCFQVKGGKGYLTMNVPKSYMLDGDGKNLLTVSYITNGETKTEDVAKDSYTPIPAGSTVIELRVK